MNPIAALLEALASPDRFAATWVNGELVIEPQSAPTSRQNTAEAGQHSRAQRSRQIKLAA